MTVIAVNFRRKPSKYSSLFTGSLEQYETQNRELLAQLQGLTAGGQNADPRTAPSLRPLLNAKRGGLTLSQALDTVFANRFRDSEELLQPWGLKPVATPLLWFGLDLTARSDAVRELVDAYGPHWRHVVARDAAALNLSVSPRPLLVVSALAVFKVPRMLRDDYDES